MSRASESQHLRLTLVEMTSTEAVQDNLAFILRALEQASEFSRGEEHPHVVSFPENSLFFRLKPSSPFPMIALDSREILTVAAAAKTLRLYVHLGSVPLTIDGRRYNSTVWINTNGEVSAPYQKIHLFDVDVEGLAPIRESESFRHGEKSAVLSISGWRVGLTICYDLRFAELFLDYRSQDADLILVPSAFTVPTGQAHWSVLLRARATECQAYVGAAAQSGNHGGQRQTYGHSMVIDPWGKVLEERQDQNSQQLISTVLDRSLVSKVRTQIPVRSHSRWLKR